MGEAKWATETVANAQDYDAAMHQYIQVHTEIHTHTHNTHDDAMHHYFQAYMHIQMHLFSAAGGPANKQYGGGWSSWIRFNGRASARAVTAEDQVFFASIMGLFCFC